MSHNRFSETKPVSQMVIESVASKKDADPLDLPPLYDAIDSDALDALFEGGFEGSVRFRYAGCTIAIESVSEGEVVTARRATEASEPSHE